MKKNIVESIKVCAIICWILCVIQLLFFILYSLNWFVNTPYFRPKLSPFDIMIESWFGFKRPAFWFAYSFSVISYLAKPFAKD